MKSSRTINESVNERLMKGWREGVVRGWIGNEQPTNKWWNWSVWDVVEVRPCGICSFMWFYILSCAFICFRIPAMCEWCANDEIVRRGVCEVCEVCKWWKWSVRDVVEVRPLGICSFMYFIVGACILCAGDVCKWVCIEMCEGWRGALRDFPYP